eukprot:c19421_g1_i3.p7 GENE.c19421_g1_i3~~c19421_g1_i3.p7  ORF type:complete len:116 (-),score=17.56 c19421_g1_i3:1123-1470(-)
MHADRERTTGKFEIFHGNKPNVSHLRVFGCKAWAHDNHPDNKLSERAWSGTLVGYDDDGATVYKIYDPQSRRIKRCRTAMFQEDEFPHLQDNTSFDEFRDVFPNSTGNTTTKRGI